MMYYTFRWIVSHSEYFIPQEQRCKPNTDGYLLLNSGKLILSNAAYANHLCVRISPFT